MKKLLKIGLLYLTIVLILSSTMVRGEYNVIAGQATDYVVTTSNWTVAVGTNSGGGTGFNLEDKNYTEGSNLNIEVTSTSPTTIYYNLTVDGDEYTSSSHPLGNLFFLLGSMFLPVMMSEMTGSTWDQAEIDMGPGLWGDFFMDTSFTSLCYMLANNQTLLDELFNTNLPINDGLTFNKIDAAFDNNTDIAIFDYALDIEWVNSTTNTNYSGIYRWKIDFDQTTGWVKGWRLFMDYSGIIEGTLFDIKWNQLVHQSGYILGDFAIGTNQFPGFEWFLIIPALGLLAMPVINKRRK